MQRTASPFDDEEVMSIDIAAKVATTQPTTQPSGAESQHGPDKAGADFKDRLDAANDPSHLNQNNNQVNQPNNVNDVQSTQKVNTGNEIPDKQDLFGRFEKVRKDFDSFVQRSSELDKMVADGKLKSDDPKVVQARRAEMREMLHLQTEMQSASVQVEIASKVVEHATSGLKTVLQTQA
jgi:hypothetical protein